MYRNEVCFVNIRGLFVILNLYRCLRQRVVCSHCCVVGLWVSVLCRDLFAGVQEEPLEESPHYDNLAFESDVHNQSEVRT